MSKIYKRKVLTETQLSALPVQGGEESLLGDVPIVQSKGREPPITREKVRPV